MPCGGCVVIPTCHNRPPYLPSRTRVGLDEQGNRVEVTLTNDWFVDRCAIWDGRGIGRNGESYPETNRFECGGCRWLPIGR